MNNNQPQSNGPSQVGPNALPSSENSPAQGLLPQEALEQFLQNPIGFIQAVVDDSARMHLSDLKEKAELRGAVNAMRKVYPEFDRFEPFIMQEVAFLIENDPDGVIDPWHVLLEKAVSSFKLKFAEMIEKAQSETTDANPAMPPAMESSANRVMPERPPVFTREQIAKMSLPEFLKMETIINSALKDKRIR